MRAVWFGGLGYLRVGEVGRDGTFALCGGGGGSFGGSGEALHLDNKIRDGMPELLGLEIAESVAGEGAGITERRGVSAAEKQLGPSQAQRRLQSSFLVDSSTFELE